MNYSHHFFNLVEDAIQVTVKKAVADTYDIEVETENTVITLHTRKFFLQKLANVLRSFTYPMKSEERVPVCLKGTVKKSVADAFKSDATTTATMSLFLSSLTVEDVNIAESTSAKENSIFERGIMSATATTSQQDTGSAQNDT